MIPLSPEAEKQLDEVLAHYERLGRPEATRNLIAALEDAVARIEQAPEAGLTAPRPYPSLASLGLKWVRQGGDGPIVAGVFYVSADIPNRL